jgi:hypothetical protein
MFVPYEATAALGSIATLKEVFAREASAKPQPAPSAAALSAQSISRTLGSQPPAMPVRTRPSLPADE